MITVVALSDTHGFERRLQIPDGDLLLHAGDFCRHGSLEDLVAFARWLGELSHAHKIVVAGNHDRVLEEDGHRARAVLADAGVVYLEDTSVSAAGLRIHGSPWTPRFMDWSFMLPQDELASQWEKIPPETDILITHGPPFGIMDRVRGRSLGCPDLLAAVRRVRPRLHLFGHIHEFFGVVRDGETHFVNAAICGARFLPERPALVFAMAVGGGGQGESVIPVSSDGRR